MARAIDADKLLEQLQKKKCGTANKRYTEGFNDCLMRVRSMIHSAPTLTPPNEPLICDGCLWAELGALEKCSSCMRDKKDNYYRRPPEGEEDA